MFVLITSRANDINLSNCIAGIIRFFNKNVLPHSLGPNFKHLKFSGKGASTVKLSLPSHACRLPLTSILSYS